MRSTRIIVPSSLPPLNGATTKAVDAAAQAAVARYSPLAVRVFGRIFVRTLRKGSHRVRIARHPGADILAAPRLVIYANHPSWWDGTVFMYLVTGMLAGRRTFSPVDAAMMDQYRFFHRIGAFGVPKDNPRRAARAFRAHAQAVLRDPTNVLLITAQDRFADPRERPLRLAPGLAYLHDLAPDALFLPLAIEYPFRDERRPEALMRFGDPVRIGAGDARIDVAALLEARLAATMDELARDVIARNDAAFETVLTGNAAIDPIYDAWRRFRALLEGRRFQAGHGQHP